MRVCEVCRALVFDWEEHTCPSGWLVWCPEEGERPENVGMMYTASVARAVEQWAEEDDAHGDYVIVQGAEPTVHVVEAAAWRAWWEDGNHGPFWPVLTFVVSGETVAEYSAREVTND